MAKRRERPAVNPLLKDRVTAIVADNNPHEVERVALAPQAGQLQSPTRTRASTASRTRERKTVHIKARFTEVEAKRVERFTRALSSYLQTTVMGAEITRALWTLAIRSEDQIARLAHKAPILDRPPYGDRLAMAEFEDSVVEFLRLVIAERLTM